MALEENLWHVTFARTKPLYCIRFIVLLRISHICISVLDFVVHLTAFTPIAFFVHFSLGTLVVPVSVPFFTEKHTRTAFECLKDSDAGNQTR